MLDIARNQLAIDLNCSYEDFEKDGFIFCEALENPGRRLFSRGNSYFEILTMGNSVIVSATSDLLPNLQKQLDGKSFDDAFSIPLVRWIKMYFLPDISRIKQSSIDGINFTVLDRTETLKLQDLQGSSNSIRNDSLRPDVLSVVAKHKETIVGIAGASADCEMLWQIGVDILPGYRRRGIATALVSTLSNEILKREKIPYYGALVNNVISLRVAYNAGFKPAWVSSYRKL